MPLFPCLAELHVLPTHKGLLQIYFYILGLLNLLQIVLHFLNVVLYIFCRYCAGNVSMSALHWSYNEKVPAFLNERPDDMITTCMEAQALSLAEI